MYRPAHDGLPTRALQAAWRAAGSRWLPPLLLVAVALDDALLMPRAPSYAVLGMFDEPAHLATSVILLAAVTAVAARRAIRVPGAFAAGLVLAGNAIDVDHVPGTLGSDVLTAGTPRPYSHSLLTLVILAAGGLIARGTRRRRETGRRRGGAALAAGLAVGVSGHLLRDLATAPVSLLWPLSDQGLTIPHPAYLGALAIAVAVACLLPRRQASARQAGRAEQAVRPGGAGAGDSRTGRGRTR
jgi:membrane-bound metal-dependent hydrolase YbcI (DUF457 family)